MWRKNNMEKEPFNEMPIILSKALSMLTFVFLSTVGLWFAVTWALGSYHPSLDDKINFLLAMTAFLVLCPRR